IRAGLGEAGVLGEETVPGMNGFGTAALGDAKNLAEVQIGLSGRRRADVVCLVCLAHMERGAVHIGKHRNRRDSQLAAGTDDPHCDLSAIGDKNLLEHTLTESEAKPKSCNSTPSWPSGAGFRHPAAANWASA